MNGPSSEVNRCQYRSDWSPMWRTLDVSDLTLIEVEPSTVCIASKSASGGTRLAIAFVVLVDFLIALALVFLPCPWELTVAGLLIVLVVNLSIYSERRVLIDRRRMRISKSFRVGSQTYLVYSRTINQLDRVRLTFNWYSEGGSGYSFLIGSSILPISLVTIRSDSEKQLVDSFLNALNRYVESGEISEV